MVIVGIDPGIAIVGYGVIDYTGNSFKLMEYGTIDTPAGTPVAKRLRMIYDSMYDLLLRYKPEAVAVEQLFWGRNVTTGINVAHARGVILLCAEQSGVSVSEYTPLQIKQAVAGYGRADKKQIQNMMKILLNMNTVPKPDDAADAIAVAICCAHSYNFEKLQKL